MKAATGEEVSAEDLGGAELHCTTSGGWVPCLLAWRRLALATGGCHPSLTASTTAAAHLALPCVVALCCCCLPAAGCWLLQG